jgi:hypothetical protein
MTSVNVPERMNELPEGTVGSVHAATGGGNLLISRIPVSEGRRRPLC